jgi:hypothetical protein
MEPKILRHRADVLSETRDSARDPIVPILRSQFSSFTLKSTAAALRRPVSGRALEVAKLSFVGSASTRCDPAPLPPCSSPSSRNHSKSVQCAFESHRGHPTELPQPAPHLHKQTEGPIFVYTVVPGEVRPAAVRTRGTVVSPAESDTTCLEHVAERRGRHRRPALDPPQTNRSRSSPARSLRRSRNGCFVCSAACPGSMSTIQPYSRLSICATGESVVP